MHQVIALASVNYKSDPDGHDERHCVIPELTNWSCALDGHDYLHQTTLFESLYCNKFPAGHADKHCVMPLFTN